MQSNLLFDFKISYYLKGYNCTFVYQAPLSSMAAILLGVSLAVNLLQFNLSNGQCNRNLIATQTTLVE